MSREHASPRRSLSNEQRRLQAYSLLTTQYSVLGFTLIELAVVLLVIGLFAAMAFPKLTGFGRGDLKLASRHLIHTVQLLVDRAEATKHLYRLNYDLEKQEYWATVLSDLGGGVGEFVPVSPTLVRRTRLKDPIRFLDVTTLRHGKVAEGEAYTQFYPNGLVEPTWLHMTEEGERTLTLVVQPLTGRVKVLEGYVELE